MRTLPEHLEFADIFVRIAETAYLSSADTQAYYDAYIGFAYSIGQVVLIDYGFAKRVRCHWESSYRRDKL